MLSALEGFGLGLSFILAIGAQNAFVLRQGLAGRHVIWVCLVCALSDAVLITVGVAGFGTLADRVPWFAPLMRYGGAAFLIWYGALSALRACRGGATLAAAGAAEGLGPAVMTALALTWLNPHVYLDTVVLLGSIAAQAQSRVAFASGAILASFTFFFALGFGARLLRPVFAEARAWQWLDAGIALVMWWLAVSLLRG